MFVDLSGDRISIIEAASGQITSVEIFVSVLGASGMLYSDDRQLGGSLESAPKIVCTNPIFTTPLLGLHLDT